MYITRRSDLDPLDAEQIVLISFFGLFLFLSTKSIYLSSHLSLHPSRKSERHVILKLNLYLVACLLITVSYMWIIEIKHIIFFF